MKTDRLMGILTVLLDSEKITAPELAERFEVSRRTVSRDIETLCMAGVPIVTEQGRGGGISIAPGYRLDKRLLDESERSAIFSGVRGLDSVSPSPKLKALEDKLGADHSADAVLIDLSSHYRESLTEKISLLKAAVAGKKLVSFRYYAENSETERVVEPYYAVFQWNDWYLLSFCTKRQDFRLFKLSRLWELKMLDESFVPREVPPEQLDFKRVWEMRYTLKAAFDPKVKYRLVEEYGPECFTVLENGQLYIEIPFTNYGNMLSWVLSFGDAAEVREPEELRDSLRKVGKYLKKKYKHDI